MPAFVNSRLGAVGMSEADGTMVCCFDLKKSRNDWRISALVIFRGRWHKTMAAAKGGKRGIGRGARVGRRAGPRPAGQCAGLRDSGQIRSEERRVGKEC